MAGPQAYGTPAGRCGRALPYRRRAKLLLLIPGGFFPNMYRVSGVRYLTCAALLALCFVPLSAQSKVAIMNFQKALLDTAEIQKKQADLEAKYKPIQDEIEKLQRDIQEIQQKLATQATQLTPQAQADLTTDGQIKQRQLQRRQEDLRDDFEEDRTEILGDAQRKMVEVVEKLAQAKDLDVVIDVSNAVYFKPALDITAEATAEYNKTYPSN
jgi:outer membrane protein